MNLKKEALYLTAVALISLLAAPAWAKDATGETSLLSVLEGGVSVQDISAQDVTALPVPQGVMPACLSFDNLASWDLFADEDNTVIELDIGTGNEVTGFGFDIGIETVGVSWLQEASITVTDSPPMAGITISPGVGFAETGDMDFSSAGLVDLSDNMLSDISVGPNGILRIELHEVDFDDNPDAIDANFRNAANPAVCPGLALVCSDQDACNATVAPEPMIPVSVNNIWALGTLVLLLALLGFVAIRRIA